jgi:hypothetical protein
MNRFRIESYAFGRIVVDGQAYTADLILLPGRILDGWWRQEGHVLHPADLDAVFNTGVDVLVVGQGAYSRMLVSDETIRALESASIKLYALPTDEAVATYASLPVSQRVAVALHLTC